MPTVFVAYPYRISEADYRSALEEVGAPYGVEWKYADMDITSQHILAKIERMMDEADFSLFDITYWNANVTLELGLAMGKGLGFFILWNPSIEHDEPPADLGGIDRIQYTDYAELKAGVGKLLEQEFGSPADDEKGGLVVMDGLAALEERVPGIVADTPGLFIGGIAARLGVTNYIASMLVKPLTEGGAIITRGNRKGTRYYMPEDAPPPEETDDQPADDVAPPLFEEEPRAERIKIPREALEQLAAHGIEIPGITDRVPPKPSE